MSITQAQKAELRALLAKANTPSGLEALKIGATRALPDLLAAGEEAYESAFASTRCECLHCKCGAHRKEARAYLAQRGKR